MRENPDLPNKKCNKGFLPVHYAALYGQKDALQFLLQKTTVDIYSGKDGAELLVRLIYANLYGKYYGFGFSVRADFLSNLFEKYN